MKKIFLLIFLLSNIILFSQEDIVSIKKGEVAKFDGFLVTREMMNILKNEDEKKTKLIELYELKISNLEKMIENYKEIEKNYLIKDNVRKQYILELEEMNKKYLVDLDKMEIYKTSMFIFMSISIAELLFFGGYFMGVYLSK